MNEPDDPFDLQRFVRAQNVVFEQVVAELQSGYKKSHWMWYVFPQLKSLGRSPRAIFYGISSLEEARGYLQHPVLGPRLEQVTRIVLERANVTLHDLFGSPDDMKFRSSMTLFSRAAGEANLFFDAVEKRCGGPDPHTTALLAN